MRRPASRAHSLGSTMRRPEISRNAPNALSCSRSRNSADRSFLVSVPESRSAEAQRDRCAFLVVVRSPTGGLPASLRLIPDPQERLERGDFDGERKWAMMYEPLHASIPPRLGDLRRLLASPLPRVAGSDQASHSDPGVSLVVQETFLEPERRDWDRDDAFGQAVCSWPGVEHHAREEALSEPIS